MTTTMIRFTAVIKSPKRPTVTKPCWVSGVKYADGPGVVAKSISWTLDREKGAAFSTATAFSLAEQFCNSPATLELRNGTVLVDDTAKLLVAQKARREANAAAMAENRRVWDELWAGMPEDLKRALVSLTGR